MTFCLKCVALFVVELVDECDENSSTSETMTPTSSLDTSFRSIDSAEDRRTLYHSKEKSITTEEEINAETLVIDLMSMEVPPLVDNQKTDVPPPFSLEGLSSQGRQARDGDSPLVSPLEKDSVPKINDLITDNVESEGGVLEKRDHDQSYNIYCSEPLALSEMSFSERSCDVHRGAHSFDQDTVEEVRGPSDSEDKGQDADDEVSSTGKSTPPLCVDQNGDLEMTPIIYWPGRGLLRDESSSETETEDELEMDSIKTLSEPEAHTSSYNLRLLADSWADYAPPKCTGMLYLPQAQGAQCLAVSDRLIWCIDQHDRVFHSPILPNGLSWEKLDEHTNIIACNKAGTSVWCIDRKHLAYCRKGITEDCPQGTDWDLVYKDVLNVAIDSNCVWVIKVSGDILMITQPQPPKRRVTLIRAESDLVQLSCCDGLVWGIDRYNNIQMLKGKRGVYH